MDSCFFLWLQNCEDDEAFRLLKLSKEEQTETMGDPEDEELIVAEYESDDESKTRSRWGGNTLRSFWSY